MKLKCENCGRIVDAPTSKGTCKACGGTLRKKELLVVYTNMDNKKILKYVILAFVGLMLIIAFFNTFYVVQAGQRSIVLTFGSPDMIPKEEGLHLKVPFVQMAVVMDIQTQKYVVEKASAASKDLQTVTTDVALNYYISPENVPEIYKKIGVHYQDKIITPAVLEVLKEQTAKYTAEELITRRPEVKEQIDVALRNRLKEFNILTQAISITNFDFSAEFNKAIESKVTAEQNALASKNKLEQIKYEAEQKVVTAKAEAESLSLQKAQVTPDLIELRRIEVQKLAIEKWNGIMPTTLLNGDGILPTIPLTV
jgi:regulator of protease activity HflC (stomatin/prohibitin superfamily)